MDPDVRDNTARHLANKPNREADPVAPPTLNLTIPGKRRGGPQAFGLPDLALSEAAFTPIHLLPPELLIEVFEFYAGLRTPVQNLIGLTLVCKLWRNIVDGTPSLWRMISGREGLPRVHKALAMAKDTPLEIAYSDKTAVERPGPFFAEIMGRIDQWKSFIVTASSMNQAIVVIKTTTAPSLGTLHLRCPWYQKWGGGTVTLFGGKPASTALKDFRADGIPVAVGSLSLSGLRSLELNVMPIISAEEILRVLRNSPDLEHCTLDELVCLKDFAFPSQEQELLTFRGVGSPTIQLSRLRSLALYRLTASFTHLVLSAIQAPNLEEFSVDCEINQPDQSPTSELFTAHISQFIPGLKSVSSRANKIQITSLPSGAWMLYIGRLYIGLQGHSLQREHVGETLQWLFGHLGGPLKDLPVTLFFHKFDFSSDWFISLASTLKVTNLDNSFSDSDRDPQLQQIISLLSRPLSFAPTQWLLPELELISSIVFSDGGKSKFLDMVKARHSFIEEQEPGAIVLKPFKEIRLLGGRNGVSTEPNRNKEFLNALQEVGRGTEIWWEGVKWTGI
ncbi:hypothetical protein FRC04_003412 [Tulasnella sp. 424]|nr:hypothetical protein FRC04_003412 [Tulasnella sp. 424]KAG8977221.1 hypothetical protein FRC05_002221 [Tulasnella sp. 425]